MCFVVQSINNCLESIPIYLQLPPDHRLAAVFVVGFSLAGDFASAFPFSVGTLLVIDYIC